MSNTEWDGEYLLDGNSEWFKYKTTYKASNGDMFAMCLVPHANNGEPFEQYLDSDTTSFRKLENEEYKEAINLARRYSLVCDIDNFSKQSPEYILRLSEYLVSLGYHK